MGEVDNTSPNVEVTTYDIPIKVIESPSGEPLSNVIVTLTGDNGTFTSTTGSAGGCNLTNVPVGEYQLTLVKEGYHTWDNSESYDFPVAENDNFDNIEYSLVQDE